MGGHAATGSTLAVSCSYLFLRNSGGGFSHVRARLGRKELRPKGSSWWRGRSFLPAQTAIGFCADAHSRASKEGLIDDWATHSTTVADLYPEQRKTEGSPAFAYATPSAAKEGLTRLVPQGDAPNSRCGNIGKPRAPVRLIDIPDVDVLSCRALLIGHINGYVAV